MPDSPSSFSSVALSIKSRRTLSCSCVCQFQPTAPGMCPWAYAVVSTSTSTSRVPGAFRFAATDSVETSTSGCLYSDIFLSFRTLTLESLLPKTKSPPAGCWRWGSENLGCCLRYLLSLPAPEDAHIQQHIQQLTGAFCR